ncbi:MAG TPA: alpha/beta fold hydrolase [Bryobacteraceae bacterium]|nr:alpha/beta fold hydrolase [Bryobacteraceae bacterium]
MRVVFVLAAALGVSFAANYPEPQEGDFTVHDYKFRSGETLPELKLHYTTVGTLKGDNAVLIMHGTGGTGKAFLSEQFGGVLFGPGGLLDATKFFIILPDDIGHGKSTKPSDGLGRKFPHYGYEDMVELEHRLVTDGLHANRLRLVMGTSMGAMHTWLWGERYPDFMDALMPLASEPIQISGRNRFFRRMVIDALQPGSQDGLKSAIYTLMVMTSSPLQMQKQAPTAAAADKLFNEQVERRLKSTNIDDMLYQYDCSRDYNPEPELESIKAPLFAINSADDQVNPPELGIMEKEIKRVKHGRYILIPISDETRGHGTHSLPKIWGGYLEELLRISEPPGARTED